MKVEKVQYQIDWTKFKVGYSFFIPCINCSEAKKSIQAIAKKQKANIVMKVVIEEGVRGIRVWRV